MDSLEIVKDQYPDHVHWFSLPASVCFVELNLRSVSDDQSSGLMNLCLVKALADRASILDPEKTLEQLVPE